MSKADQALCFRILPISCVNYILRYNLPLCSSRTHTADQRKHETSGGFHQLTVS